MFRKMRRFKQQVGEDECRVVLKEQWRGVLSLIGDEGYPYGIPINFVYDEDSNTIYFHAAKSGHKIDAIKACDKACFTVWNEGYKKPGEWALNITSVIAFGRVRLVDDLALAEAKARQLAAKYFPTQEEIDVNIAKYMREVQMIALDIEHVTGKLVNES